MNTIIKTYPHFVEFPRTPNWFSGDWADISSWCSQSFGSNKWEYYDGGFRFIHERDAAVFVLRWR